MQGDREKLPEGLPKNENELRMLESILAEMNGQRRGYLTKKFEEIKTRMNSDNEIEVLQALMDLNTEINMTEEEHYILKPISRLIPDVLRCLKMAHMPEIMIHSSISLNYILDLVPESAEIVVQNDGLQILTKNVQNFEYIDLAENAIRSFEMISMEFSNGILKIGAVDIMVNLINFLVGSSQKYILKIISRVFKNFSDISDFETKILHLVPQMRQYFAQHMGRFDETAVEVFGNLTKRLYRLTENDVTKMEDLINKVALGNGLIDFMLLIGNRSLENIKPSTPKIVQNLMIMFNKYTIMSPDLTRELLFNGVNEFLIKALDNRQSLESVSEGSKFVVYELVGLVNSLLCIEKEKHEAFEKLAQFAGIRVMKHQNVDRKKEIVEENRALIEPVLVKIIKQAPDIFESNEDFFFKYLLLTSIRKISFYLPGETLQSNISEISLANFISKTLECKDLLMVVLSLLIVKTVEKKLPELTKMLSREGIKVVLQKLVEPEYIDKCKLPEVLAKNSTQNKQLFDPGLAKKLFKGKLNDKNDLDNFMKQLTDWQKDPKLLLDTLKHMKQKEKGMKIQTEEDVEIGRLTGEEEDKRRMEEKKKLEELMRKEEEELLKKEETLEKLFDDDLNLEGENNGEKEEMTEKNPDEIPGEDQIQARLAALEPNPGSLFEEALKSENKRQLKKRKKKTKKIMDFGELEQVEKFDIPVEKKKPGYDLKIARKEISELAQEILKSIGDNFSSDSKEMQELLKISELLKKDDEEGIKLLSEFFNKDSTMTFFEFSKSELIKNLIDYLIKPEENSKEIKSKKLSLFLSEFYKNEAKPMNNFYKNLKSFVTRIPEITPFASTDQETMGSFVQELRYLSTPLRIKVNYDQELTSILDVDEFIGYVNKGSVNLEKNTVYQIYEDAVNLLDDFCDSFLSNPTILFQVERFASLASVEKYMINKFATKILMSINEDFGKRKRKASSMSKKEILEKNEQENGAFIENEEKDKILTKHYLEQKMREKVMIGDEKELRKNLEKQFLRKPTKIIQVNFEIIVKDPENPENDIRKHVENDVTILELVNKIKELTEEAFSVELNFGLKLKTDFFGFSQKSMIPFPQLDSSIGSVLESIRDDIMTLEVSMDQHKVSETLKNILIAIKILLEIDQVKTVYLDSCNSKLHQSIKLEGEEKGILQHKLEKNHDKLSEVYTRIFKEPIRILGKQFPKLVKVLFRTIPSMFDFNARYLFFKHVAFGPTRAMYFIHQANKPAFKELPGSKIGRLRRKKLKVSREKLMEGAEITFNFSHSLSTLLEFDFDYEEGSGLGPTLEFYSMIADEFKRDEDMWRETDDYSYFPKPIQPSQRDSPESENIFHKWKILGAICGRGILDQRVFDIRLSAAFWKVVLGYKCTLADLSSINKNLQNILNNLQAISNKFEEIKIECQDPECDQTVEDRMEELEYNGVNIEDLCLFFTLPGFDDFELIENGADVTVTLENLQEYIEKVIHFYLVDSILFQVEQFRDGFNQFMNIEKLFCFKAEELELVICGDKLEDWTLDYLKENIIPSHGFGKLSDAFVSFLEVLSKMDMDEIRQFLLFTIGSPRLPLGGLKGLSPQLTVVKKISSYPDQSPDMLLPSVMTCQNYIKLPDYSNKEVLKNKLFLAMKEGQKSFSLS